MALPKFLLQSRTGQTATVYRWTEALAKRSDMRPITGKEAKKILDSQEAERQEREKRKSEDMFLDKDDDFSDNDLLADPDLETKEPVKPAEHPSFMTQDLIADMELAKISEFKTKNDLEVYFLEKYQFNMIAGTREEMDAQATAFVKELQKHEKLYMVLNE